MPGQEELGATGPTVPTKSGRGRATRASLTRSGTQGTIHSQGRSPAAAMTPQRQPDIQTTATAGMQTSQTLPAAMQTSQILATEIQTAAMQTSQILPTEIQTAAMQTSQTSPAEILQTAAASNSQAQGPAISKRMAKRMYHQETDSKKLREEINTLNEKIIELTRRVDELQQKEREREKEREKQEMMKNIRLELAAAAPYYQYQPTITPIRPAVQPRLPPPHQTFAQSYNAPTPSESSYSSYENNYQ